MRSSDEENAVGLESAPPPAVAPGVIPVDANGDPLANKQTQKFTFADDDEGPKERVTDIGFSNGAHNNTNRRAAKDVSTLVVPIGGDIIDSDAVHRYCG